MLTIWPPVGHTLEEVESRPRPHSNDVPIGLREGDEIRTYRDGHTDHHLFRDTGCEYHDACLTCPFSICIKYEGPSLHAIKRTIRQKSIVEDNKSGLSVIQIAEKYNCSRRHVYKLLKEGIAPLVSRVIA